MTTMMFRSATLIQTRLRAEVTAITVTLDIGNACSGYAYTTNQDFLKDNWTVKMNDAWSHDSHMTQKTNTSLLIAPKESLDKGIFGYDAESEFAEQFLNGNHQDYMLFRDIKQSLYKDGVDFEAMITDVNSGKKLVLCDVLLALLKFFRNKALERIKARFSDIPDTSIFWVLTVPSAWKIETVMLYRDLATEAGISYRRLKVVTEPEACLAYVMQYINTQVEMKKRRIYANIISVFDARIMLVDLSGDSTTLSVHRVSGDKTYKMVYQSRSHKKGSSQVNEQFLLFLSNLIGEDIIRTLKNDYVDDYMTMCNEFEMEKRKIEPQSRDKDSFSFKLPYQIEETFKEQYKDEYKSITQRIEDKSDYYKHHVRYEDGRLHVDVKVLKELFDVVLDKIENYIRNVLEMKACARVASLILVGGFSESKMVQEGMRKRFDEMVVITPQDPELAIMKGAIMLAVLPEIEPPIPDSYHKQTEGNIISSICTIA